MNTGIDYKRMVDKCFATLEDLNSFIEMARDANTHNETKYSREWWTIAAYAYYHLIAGKFVFPLNVRRGESPKPDFWIKANNLSDEFGIETTFCCEEKYEQAKRICKERNDGSYPINTSFMKNDIGHFDESSFQLQNQALHGMPIYGNYSTAYTIDRITKSIDEKIAKYNELRGLFSLVVYVNLPSNVYIEGNDKAEICKALSAYEEYFKTFKSIEILWSKNDVRAI